MTTTASRTPGTIRSVEDPPCAGLPDVAPPSAPRDVVTVELVGDCEVVTHGLAAMMRPYRDRIVVVPPAGCLSGRAGPGRARVLLFDCYPFPARDGLLEAREPGPTGDHRPVAYTWPTGSELVQAALQRGFRGYLSKSLSAPRLAAALVRLAAGETVVEPDGADRQEPEPQEQGWAPRWPGDTVGLTPREADVIALVTSGASNVEIAATLGVSINSVKSYIRSAYRKMGVTSRRRAVLWGVAHGFQPH